ncbi:MAG: Eco57I restriction-modification methylase domain-containing protein [Dolichospermum sp. BR01]|nr:Eco57I restriction-modification methylase domain-containing protein [Dolichospermum sp. BR01]
MQLTRFNEIDFLPALKEFFGKSNLNVPINYVDDKPTSAKKILQNTYKDNEAFRLINDVYFVGLVDDAAFRGNQSLAIDNIKSDYDGILIFGVTLNNRDHGQLPTRFLGRASLSHLAEIARAFNREFCYTPVVIIFKYDEYLAFANTERLKYKDNREGEKAGKVTLLRNIDIKQPHSGHQRILAELAIPTTGKDRVDSFAKLYQYWQKVLDVSLLNKQFYQEVSAWYFYACKQVVFPKDAKNNQESLIRLITRLMFVWFLKEKGLVPNQLFNKTDIESILKSVEPQESTYYKAILQNLFFATLNTEGKRKFIKESSGGRNSQHMVHNVFRYKDYFQDPDGVIDRYFDDIPFLNGGLFECLDVPSQKDKPDTEKRIDGFSNHSSNVLSVPNELFFDGFQDVDLNADFGTSRKKYRVRGLLEIFKSYKFTIAENTPFEEDVALDPELLGQVFENLLAAYNPETQTTARKQTGSFYTPREIVNYMIDESLIAYFKEKLKSKQENFTEQDFDGRLRLLLDYQSSVNSFEDDSDVTLALIESIDNCKILDPACGSGAFPMGILQKMVHILAKLDPRNLNWKQRQIDRLNQLIIDAEDIEDEKTRTDTLTNLEAQKENLERAFARNGLDYGRKLFLIQNCIYGVDIQSIAVQIAKLRFFISLIIDQQEDQDETNRGILPLPNLETKFVAANSLIGVAKVQQLSVFDTQEIQAKRKQLERLRRDHFFAKSLETKRKKRQEDERLSQQIGEILRRNKSPNVESLQSWKPYDQNASADFFDPEWMFGIKDGFDICIGNPPYVRQEQIKELKPVFKQNFQCFTGVADLFVYFFERGYQLLKTGGVLSYICSSKYFRSGYGEKLRDFLGKNTTIQQLIDFGDTDVFTAIAYPSIILFRKEKASKDNQLKALSWQQTEALNEFPTVFNAQNFLMPQSALKADGWRLENPQTLDLLAKLQNVGKPLEEITGKICIGIKTGFNEAFVIDKEIKDKLISEHSSSAEVLKPFLRGRDLRKWSIDFADQYLIKIESSENREHIWSNKPEKEAEEIFAKKYPAIYRYFEQFRSQLINRSDQGRFFWELRSCKYWQDFENPKIIFPDIAPSARYTYHKDSLYVDMTAFIIPTQNLYVLGILNSNLAEYFISLISSSVRGDYLRFKRQYVSQIPIPTTTEAEQKAIETLVGYVLHLTAALKDISNHPTTLDQSVTDKRMNRYFEEIIDALVMELYLPEELHTHDKYFMRYILSENLPTLETILGDKIEKLRQIFGRLFDKEHPIRHNLFLLNTIPVVRIIEGKS